MRRKKNVTMQDIADYLSISKVTVSKALNGKDGVGSDLKEKILEISRQLGYKLPGSGGTLPRKSGCIAIFMKDKFARGEAGFYLEFYQRISVRLSREGYFAHLFPVGPKDDRGERITSLLKGYDITGIIFLGDLGKKFLGGVKGTGLPCIMVDSYDSDLKLDCVVTESVYCMYEMTSYLMKCGHKKIGFVGTISATNSIMDRFLGYYRAHLEAGIPVTWEWIIKDRSSPDSEEVEFTLPQLMPTAFVCNCDDTAYQFIRVLNERGYLVPDDISIVSFDNDIHAELCIPKLTTAEVNIKQMADQSVELICKKIEESSHMACGVTFVNATIIYRDSVKVIE